MFFVEVIQRYFDSRKRSWQESTTNDPALLERINQQNKNRRQRASKSRVINYYEYIIVTNA